MNFARIGLGGSFLLLGFACLSESSIAASNDSSMSGAYSARDVRIQTRTQWDYQPGQGPHKPLRDQRCMNCAASNVAAPLPPPPPVQKDDWKDPPPAEASMPVEPPSIEPKTESSFDVGLQASSFRYREKNPAPGMKNKGEQYGLGMAYNGALGSNWFARWEGRVVAGPTKYSSGTISKDVTTFIGETRAVLGWDLMFGRFGVSPYIGVGYRFLQTDLNAIAPGGGTKSVKRQGQYLFAPIGLQPRYKFPNGNRLILTAEFDPLIRGWQKDYYSDITDAFPDIQNKQKSGYGLRGEISYEFERFAFGPFFNYWNIGSSSTDCGTGSGPGGQDLCSVVPHNTTTEYGLNLRYRFH